MIDKEAMTMTSRGMLCLAVVFALLAGCRDEPAPRGPACEGRGFVLEPRLVAPVPLPPAPSSRSSSTWLRVEFPPGGKRMLYIYSITGQGALRSVDLETGASQVLLPDIHINDRIVFTANGQVAVVASKSPDDDMRLVLRAIWLEDGRVVTLARSVYYWSPEVDKNALPFAFDPEQRSMVTSEPERNEAGVVQDSLISVSLEDGSRTRLTSPGTFVWQPSDPSMGIERVFFHSGGELFEWVFSEGAPRHLLSRFYSVFASVNGQRAIATTLHEEGPFGSRRWVETYYHLPSPSEGGGPVQLWGGRQGEMSLWGKGLTRFSPDGKRAILFDRLTSPGCDGSGGVTRVFQVDFTAPKMDFVTVGACYESSVSLVFSPNGSHLLMPLWCEESCWGGEHRYQMVLAPTQFSNVPQVTESPGGTRGRGAFTASGQWALWDDNYQWVSEGTRDHASFLSKDLRAAPANAPENIRLIGSSVNQWAPLGRDQVIWAGSDGRLVVHHLVTGREEEHPCGASGERALPIPSPGNEHVLVVAPRTGTYPDLQRGQAYVVSEDGTVSFINSPPWDLLDKDGYGFFRWANGNQLVMLGEDGLSLVDVKSLRMAPRVHTPAQAALP